jgi:hypothetical protein
MFTSMNFLFYVSNLPNTEGCWVAKDMLHGAWHRDKNEYIGTRTGTLRVQGYATVSPNAKIRRSGASSAHLYAMLPVYVAYNLKKIARANTIMTYVVLCCVRKRVSETMIVCKTLHLIHPVIEHVKKSRITDHCS